MKVDRRNGYLRAEVGWGPDFSATKRDIGTVVTAAVREACSRILIDARGAGRSPTLLEQFELGSHIAQAVSARGLWVALVEAGEGSASNSFTELVARNRGALVRVFFDCEDAVRWLRTERPRKPGDRKAK